MKPYRSALYIPGDRARALEKARGLACDAILFDLEDAVAPDSKDAARDTLRAALGEGGYGARARIVRINGFDTPWADADLAALAGLELDGVLLPKVADAQDVARLRKGAPDGVGLWAMIETPAGVMAARDIAEAPGMAGFVLGTNDLAKELGTRHRADRAPLQTALQQALIAARGAGIVAIDGVYNAFKDAEGLAAECEQGRDWGFDGKSLIHPAQLEVANRIFAPSPDDVALAQRQIEAFERATSEGRGVAVVDGKIVENLHVATGRALLAKAEAITALEQN